MQQLWTPRLADREDWDIERQSEVNDMSTKTVLILRFCLLKQYRFYISSIVSVNEEKKCLVKSEKDIQQSLITEVVTGKRKVC